MRTDGQYGPDRQARPAAEPGRGLIPVLARALEVGRGPPGLVAWMASRPVGPSADAVARLAAELNSVVRRAGVAETLAE